MDNSEDLLRALVVRAEAKPIHGLSPMTGAFGGGGLTQLMRPPDTQVFMHARFDASTFPGRIFNGLTVELERRALLSPGSWH